MGAFSMIIYIVLIFGLLWFIMIRPQQKQAKKRAEMLTALKAGDRIVTIGGICGTISRITEDKVYIEISDGIVIEMLRNSISSVETEESLQESAAEDAEEEEDEDEDLYYDEEDEDVIDVEDVEEVEEDDAEYADGADDAVEEEADEQK